MLHVDYHNLEMNTMRPRQNGRHFADDIFKWIFLIMNEMVSGLFEFSLKFVLNQQPASFSSDNGLELKNILTNT